MVVTAQGILESQYFFVASEKFHLEHKSTEQVLLPAVVKSNQLVPRLFSVVVEVEP